MHKTCEKTLKGVIKKRKKNQRNKARKKGKRKGLKKSVETNVKTKAKAPKQINTDQEERETKEICLPSSTPSETITSRNVEIAAPNDQIAAEIAAAAAAAEAADYKVTSPKNDVTHKTITGHYEARGGTFRKVRYYKKMEMIAR